MSGPAAGNYREVFYLGLRDHESDLRLVEHLSRKQRRVWVTDEFEFSNLSKLAPALVYRRSVPVYGGGSAVASSYLGSELDPQGQPAAPAGVDVLPGYSARSVEERAMLLEQTRSFAGASRGDPWFDVATGYAYYSARVLIQGATNLEDTVWFMSVGPEDDGIDALRASVRSHLLTTGGSVAAVRGPAPAYHHGTPASGMVLARSVHNLGGDDEFIERFVTFDAWARALTA
jgi:hypothetical protein